MTYDQKVGRFCIKSGPFTGRKQAVNSLKANECDLLNMQPHNTRKIFRLKGKTYKMVTVFGVFLICLPTQGGMTDIKKLKICISKSRGH